MYDKVAFIGLTDKIKSSKAHSKFVCQYFYAAAYHFKNRSLECTL
jgi:hypothetical protein